MKKLAIFILLSFSLTACGKADPALQAFASCIEESGAVFYGSFLCVHCNEQKDMFKSAKEDLPYVECDPRAGKDSKSAVCEANQVTGYPTWIFKDGSRLVGTQSFETLAEKTSCSLPGQQSVMEQ